jgi:VanZ family protein
MNRQLLWAGLYAVLIVALSSIPGRSFPDVRWLSYDKLIHFGEYAVFSVLVYRAAASLKLQDRFLLGLAIVLAGLFGALDELYQLLIPGRDSSFADWSADQVGAVLGAVSYIWWVKRRDQPSVH